MTSRLRISQQVSEKPRKPKLPPVKSQLRAQQQLRAHRCPPTSATRPPKTSAWKKCLVREPARRPHRLRPRQRPPKSNIKRIKTPLAVRHWSSAKSLDADVFGSWFLSRLSHLQKISPQD